MANPGGAGVANKPKVHRIRLIYGPNKLTAVPEVARVLPGDKLLFIREGGDPEAQMRVTFTEPGPFSTAVLEQPSGVAVSEPIEIVRALDKRIRYTCELVKNGKVVFSSELESVGGGELEPDTGDRRRD